MYLIAWSERQCCCGLVHLTGLNGGRTVMAQVCIARYGALFSLQRGLLLAPLQLGPFFLVARQYYGINDGMSSCPQLFQCWWAGSKNLPALSTYLSGYTINSNRCWQFCLSKIINLVAKSVSQHVCMQSEAVCACFPFHNSELRLKSIPTQPAQLVTAI